LIAIGARFTVSGMPDDVSQPPATGASVTQIDRVCDAFETAWKAGRQPRIEQFLGESSEPERSALLRELLNLERAYRFGPDDTFPWTEYQERFPGHEKLIREVFASPREAVTQNLSATRATAASERRSLQLPDVIGKYRIHERIGAGGMGIVFRATHTMINHEVALKVLHPDILEHPSARRRFLTEAQACATMDHPNIVKTYHIDEEGELIYLVMALLDGQDIAQHVKEHGPLSHAETLRVLWHVARGLDYAHRRGIVHRDIKPHNIMLLRNGMAKVLDLGLARLRDQESNIPIASTELGTFPALANPYCTRLTHTGRLIGTLAYISPEQAVDSRSVDARTDLYSLGCSAYFMLTGRNPFDAAVPEPQVERNDTDTLSVDPPSLERTEAAAILRRHALGEFLPLPSVHPELPPGLTAVVHRLMASDLSSRYESARALLRDLEQLASELKIWLPRDEFDTDVDEESLAGSTLPRRDWTRSPSPARKRRRPLRRAPFLPQSPSNRAVALMFYLALFLFAVGMLAVIFEIDPVADLFH
jgi:serine/threonine-protein kinase